MPRSWVKISDTVFLESPDQLLFFTLSVAHLCWLQPIHIQHSQVFCLLQAFQNVDHFQQILDHLWSICASCLFVLHSLHHPWKPSESSRQFPWRNASLTQNLMLICWSTCSVILNVTTTHYTCSLNSCLPPQLTRTEKSSLFTHALSPSPLSLVARLHWCCTSHSCYTNNGWIFSGQTSYNSLHPKQ